MTPRDVYGHRQAGATPAWVEPEETPARWGGLVRGNTLGLRETEDEPLLPGGWRPPTPAERARARQRAARKRTEA